MWYKVWSAKGLRRRIELHVLVDSKKARVLSTEFYFYFLHDKEERLETIALNEEDLIRLRSVLYSLGIDRNW